MSPKILNGNLKAKVSNNNCKMIVEWHYSCKARTTDCGSNTVYQNITDLQRGELYTTTMLTLTSEGY